MGPRSKSSVNVGSLTRSPRLQILPILVYFLLCPISLRAEDGPYAIDDFASVMDVARDGGVAVKETIRVTFLAARRGIFRFIPVDYEFGWRANRHLALKVEKVEDNRGHAQTTRVAYENGNVVIRIGDENIFLPAGTKRTYVITYKTWGTLNWFDRTSDWDPYAELYWNLTGDRWDVPIQQSSFRVNYPKAQGGERIRMSIYAGRHGSRLSDNVVGPAKDVAGVTSGMTLSLTDDSAFGERRKPLEPGEGATLVLNLPADLIPKPSLIGSVNFHRYVLPNLGIFTPLMIVIGLYILWWIYGRDPRTGPVAVRYEPPDNLSGPEAGAFIDERIDQRDIAAGIISLVVKGYLNIKPAPDRGPSAWLQEITLEVPEPGQINKMGSKEDFNELNSFEALLLGLIKKGGKKITETEIQDHVAPRIEDLQRSLYQCLITRGYYRKTPEAVRFAWFLGGIAASALLAFLCFLNDPVRNPWPPLVGGILGIIPAWLFSRWMPRRTRRGARAYNEILGFQEFIRRARGKDLDWKAQKRPDQALFDRYLPHAVAFGLTRQWSDAFNDALAEPPTWYLAPHGNAPFSWSGFGRSVNDFGYSLGLAAITPFSRGADSPSSFSSARSGWGSHSGGGFSGGGFGGGGFSGGGSGGGGGGSW